MCTIIDISPPIVMGVPVWPGDTPFSLGYTCQIDPEQSCPVRLTSITLSPHTGAHADAPSHYQHHGADISQVALEAYLGRCQVIHCLSPGPLITLAAIQQRLEHNVPAERLLIRTYVTYPNAAWDHDFPGLEPQAIHWLGKQGVKLIGVDTASLDPMYSKTLDAHHATQQHGIAILEQLYLDRVEEGQYELIALPLAIQGAEASPVRAVLRTYPV